MTNQTVDAHPGQPAVLPSEAGGGPPFGPAFFASALHDRVRAACAADPAAVPGVVLHLADGGKLDLCHITTLEASWLAALVFRDRESCTDMDAVFVPYGLVTRVTVTLDHSRSRALGFRLPEG